MYFWNFNRFWQFPNELQTFEIFDFADFRDYCSVIPLVFKSESLNILIQSEERMFLFVVKFFWNTQFWFTEVFTSFFSYSVFCHNSYWK